MGSVGRSALGAMIPDESGGRSRPIGVAFDRTVVVDHRMSELLANMRVQERGSRFRGACHEALPCARGETEARDLFRRTLFYCAQSEVRHVICITTGHRWEFSASA